MSHFNFAFVEMLGWMLVHSLWLLLGPAVLLGITLCLVPQRFSRTRYNAGLGVLGVMAALPFSVLLWVEVPQTTIEVAEPEFAANVRATLTSRTAGSVDEVDLPLRGEPEDAASPSLAVNDADSADAGRRVQVDPSTVAAVSVRAESTVQIPSDKVVGLENATTTSADFAVRVKPILPWAVAVWLCGVLLMTVRLLFGWRTSVRLRRQEWQPVSAEIRSVFEELRERIGASLATRLVTSTLVRVPSVIGHLKPVVLLPMSAVTGLNAQQLRAILAHELAHVQRYDYAVNILQTVVETVLFYHPAIWWVTRVVRDEREHCCDDVALAVGCPAFELAGALIAVDATRDNATRPEFENVLVTAADGGNLLRRIRRIAKVRSDDSASRRSWIAGILVLVALVATSLFVMPQSTIASDEETLIARQNNEDSSKIDGEGLTLLTASRIEFEGDYFIELAAISDFDQQQAAAADKSLETPVAAQNESVWNTSGQFITAPFAGVRLSPPGQPKPERIGRKFYVRGEMPDGTTIDLDVDGERMGGSGVQTSEISSVAELKASVVAYLPTDQQTVDVTVKLHLPTWRTIVEFPPGDHVRNGATLERDTADVEKTRIRVSGDFGGQYRHGELRIVTYDGNDNLLKTRSTGTEAGSGILHAVSATYDNSKGQPQRVLVQRRIATLPIIFRNVPLHAGKRTNVSLSIPGAVPEGDVDRSAGWPLTILMAEPPGPTDAKLDGDNPASADDAQAEPQPNADSEPRTAKQSAPHDVPLPDKDWIKPFPASGSGLRVPLDDRRWIEFIGLASDVEVDGEKQKIVWRTDGELFNPPQGFDPLTLVPDAVNGDMPKSSREVLAQLVGPKGIQFSLNTSGYGGWGQFPVTIDDHFEQVPINTVMSGIADNHAYVEVKVTRENWSDAPLQGGEGFQTVIEEDERRLFVITHEARLSAWQLDAQVGTEAQRTVGPMMVADLNSRFGIPDNLREKVRGDLQSAGVVVFVFDKARPMPTFRKLRYSRYDTVRFDNLSVFPGPRSAVRVSVNGVPVSTAAPAVAAAAAEQHAAPSPKAAKEMPSKDSAEKAAPLPSEAILLEGKVVDADGKLVPDCWVGMFVEPLNFNEGMSPRTTFDNGPQLSHQTQTDDEGRFSILAKKNRSVFEGSFWAVRSDGASGNLSMNTSWSYLQKKLTIRVDAAIADIQVIDPNDQPVANAKVVLEAVQKPRSVADRLPAEVQTRQTRITDISGRTKFGGWPSVAIRGIAVTAAGYGTQFLDSARSSQWVEGDEPLTLKLHPAASLSGCVAGFDSKKHASLQLQIETEQHAGRPPLNGRAIVDVNDDGSFEVDAIAAGRVTFSSSLLPDSLTKIDFPRVAALKPDEVRVLEEVPQLVPAVTVRQRIIKSDTGEGIPDMRLRVLWGSAVQGDGSWRDSKPTTTDADGWWTAHVLPGTINVRISGGVQGYQGTAWFDGRSGYLGVEAQIPATDEMVTLPPEAYVPSKTLQGRLQFADGSPAANWMAYGHPISWDDVGVGGVRTQQDGSFTWNYPVGYPPRLYNVSNREWMTEHGFKDRFVIPQVISTAPLVLKIPEQPPVQ